MNIVEVLPQADYMLYVEAEDDVTGVFDVKPYMQSEAFAPLQEVEQFRQVQNGGYFIEWDCGADLSIDTILARWQIKATDGN